jgi:L-asparagine oxygenase
VPDVATDLLQLTETTPVVEYTLSAREVGELRDVTAGLCPDSDSPVNPAFYEKYWHCHTRLPGGLHRFLEDFRRNEPAAAALVHGFPVDDALVGPTPAHWDRPVTAASPTAQSDRYLALCALALGEPFAWATLQHGRVIQDVFPIRGDEERQNGHGSDAFLVFHTDDAFHPDTCDYLLLFGVRNHDAVPTLATSVRELRLDPWDRQLLSEDRFHIDPDEEHIRQLAARMPGHPALRRALQMRDEPHPVPLLFGTPDNPYLRYDRYYTRCAGGDPEAVGAALDALDAELNRLSSPLVIGQGTLLVLDNKVAAHARNSFTARYDGTDRWLRKIIVSRGLRKWAGTKADPGGRLVL